MKRRIVMDKNYWWGIPDENGWWEKFDNEKYPQGQWVMFGSCILFVVTILSIIESMIPKSTTMITYCPKKTTITAVGWASIIIFLATDSLVMSLKFRRINHGH